MLSGLVYLLWGVLRRTDEGATVRLFAIWLAEFQPALYTTGTLNSVVIHGVSGFQSLAAREKWGSVLYQNPPPDPHPLAPPH